MAESLADLIKARKGQARKRGIAQKVMIVTKRLDPDREKKRSRMFSKLVNYSLDRGDLQLSYLTGMAKSHTPGLNLGVHEVKVNYSEGLVFDSRNNEIDLYIPGEWESELEDLYLEVAEAVRAREEEYRLREEESLKEKEGELRAKWQL